MYWLKSMLLAMAFAGEITLPAFEFTQLNGDKLTQENLTKNQPVLVFYYDPFCDHCNEQAKLIQADFDRFTNYTLIWVSWGEEAEAANFQSKYFDGKDNVLFAIDSEFNFDAWFGYSEVPTTYVFDNNWVQISKFDKEVSVDELLGGL
ncbi:MAG: redoxin domain-containing protein [Bacteroidetes bacterium]|nr:redoxin domain-containing protein [Bacteroidota bacterium]